MVVKYTKIAVSPGGNIPPITAGIWGARWLGAQSACYCSLCNWGVEAMLARYLAGASLVLLATVSAGFESASAAPPSIMTANVPSPSKNNFLIRAPFGLMQPARAGLWVATYREEGQSTVTGEQLTLSIRQVMH